MGPQHLFLAEKSWELADTLAPLANPSASKQEPEPCLNRACVDNSYSCGDTISLIVPP